MPILHKDILPVLQSCTSNILSQKKFEIWISQSTWITISNKCCCTFDNKNLLGALHWVEKHQWEEWSVDLFHIGHICTECLNCSMHYVQIYNLFKNMENAFWFVWLEQLCNYLFSWILPKANLGKCLFFLRKCWHESANIERKKLLMSFMTNFQEGVRETSMELCGIHKLEMYVLVAFKNGEWDALMSMSIAVPINIQCQLEPQAAIYRRHVPADNMVLLCANT